MVAILLVLETAIQIRQFVGSEDLQFLVLANLYFAIRTLTAVLYCVIRKAVICGCFILVFTS